MTKKKKRRRTRHEEAWTALAEALGGEPVENRRGRLKMVRFPAEPWTIVLDHHTPGGDSSSGRTRVRATFRMRDDFRFRVFRRNLLTDVGKVFGMQDIEVGMPQLDRDYIVQSSSPGKVQALLIARDVAKPLEALRAGRFEVRKVRRLTRQDASLRELIYHREGLAYDADTLRLMVGLVQAALKHMVRLGAAVREPAGIRA